MGSLIVKFVLQQVYFFNLSIKLNFQVLMDEFQVSELVLKLFIRKLQLHYSRLTFLCLLEISDCLFKLVLQVSDLFLLLYTLCL